MDVPSWVSDALKKDKCPGCSKPFRPEAIKAIGVKYGHVKKDSTVVYVEYHCPHCKEDSLVELFEMTMEEFGTAILDDFEERAAEEAQKEMQRRAKSNNNPKKKAKKRPSGSQSKISLEEQKQAMDMLDTCESWVDWLNQIGAPLDLAFDDTKKPQIPLDGETDEDDSETKR